MLSSIRSYLGLIRFSHTVFALPFALTSASLAWSLSWVDLTLWAFTTQLIGILLCMVFARSAAMAFNRLVDRDIDAMNPRTAGRHLPSGELSPIAVWGFFASSVMGFIASTLVFWPLGNPWPLYLCGPVLMVICLYSYTKRFTALCHFWLGLSLFLAPLAAWIAIRGDTIWSSEIITPALLGASVLFWVAGFDILYACQDVDFDRKTHLHSIPAALGVRWSLRVAMLCHVLMVITLFTLAFVSTDLGWIFLAGVGLVAVLLAYEHWLVGPTDLSRINQAFFLVNAVVSIGLFVLVLLQLAVGF